MCNNAPWSNGSYAGDWTWDVYLKAVPGRQGYLYLTQGALGAEGSPVLNTEFMRSPDGGATWTAVPDMTSVSGFDFGKPAAGAAWPAIYVLGYLSGVYGAYRSLDNCATWQLLAAAPNNSVDFLRNIGADKNVFGRFYITTGGSGAITGQLNT